jgi:hypothetical protein
MDTADQLMAHAAAQGAELAVLPEYFCLMGHQDTDKLQIAETYGDGPMQSALSAMAKRHGLGLRSARENIADLIDADSFSEYGALAVPVVGNSVRVTTVPLVPRSELTFEFKLATLAVPTATL